MAFASTLVLVSALISPALGAAAAAAKDTAGVQASSIGDTGVIVPLYIYPGEEWDELIEIKNNNTGVPMVAIVNPASGPGTSKDSAYAAGIRELKAAGIIVLGYVWTDYGDRSSSLVRSEISLYKRWYSVDGIFFDAMSNLKGKLKYYNNLDNYVKSKGLTLTVGNPGTDTRRIYIGSVDNMVIYENAGTPELSYLGGGWHGSYDKSNFSFISYDVPSLDESFVANATQYVGYLYITDDDLPNPFDSLPGYLGDLVAAVGRANAESP